MKEPAAAAPQAEVSMFEMLLILAAGGGAAAYFLVLKPKQGKKVPSDLDDLDLEDEELEDEEYLKDDEDETEMETMEAPGGRDGGGAALCRVR